MYPICYRRVSGRYFQPEPAMYSRCFHRFPGPLAPSDTIPSSQVFDLVISFPLLEDLTVVANHGTWAGDNDDSNWASTVAQPSNQPTLKGSLDLHIGPRGITPIVHRLLSLPGGLHFQKLTLRWYHEGDISSTMILVKECSPTLESLDITCNLFCASIQNPCPPL